MSQKETEEKQQTVFKEGNEQAVTVESRAEPATEKKSTATGLEENLAGLLCYSLGIITGVIFIILEKENRFVRFHAFQSIFIVLTLIVINFVLAVIPIIGWLISLLIAPLALILWLFLMYQAYQGKYFKLPIIGNIAEKQASQG